MFFEENGRPFGLVRIGFSSEEDERQYRENKVYYNKQISKFLKAAAQNAKKDCCALCGKACTSFCNSHSVPSFALRRIAENGKVVSPLQGEIPTFGESYGVKQAGTFRLICQECDNTVFQQYEDPNAYEQEPTDQMLAQIALKEQLQMISKRNEERELYTLLKKKNPNIEDQLNEEIFIGECDLRDFYEGLNHAKKALANRTGKSYHLCFYKKLNYVVPYAAQVSVMLISDFEDRVINNIYCMDKRYKLKTIYAAVLPLKDTSVVLMFIEDNDPRYRAFYRQLNKLPIEDQLSAINYIIFSYSENVFLNPTVSKKVKEDQRFMDTCRKSMDFMALPLFSNMDLMSVAIKGFSLSRRNEIPNLLSKEFAIELS